jgi:hypothetical protein
LSILSDLTIKTAKAKFKKEKSTAQILKRMGTAQVARVLGMGTAA